MTGSHDAANENARPNVLNWILGAAAIVATFIAVGALISQGATVSSDARDAKAGLVAIQAENLSARMITVEAQMAEYKADQKLTYETLEALKRGQQRLEDSNSALAEKMSLFIANVMPIRPRK